jgi:hypothetical protein
MANTKTLGSTGLVVVRLDTTGTVNVGEAAEGVTGSWVLQVSGTFTGSLVLCKKIRRGSVSDADAAPTYYEDMLAGTSTAANTAITAAGLFRIPCDSSDLVLDYTATDGTMVCELVPQLG